MPICKANLSKAAKMIGSDHARLLARFANQQDKIESQWRAKFRAFIERINERIAEQLAQGKSMDEIMTPTFIKSMGFEDAIFQHFLEVSSSAIRTATHEEEFISIRKPKRLAKPPKMKVPKSLRDLQQMYDDYRKKGFLPKRQQKIAEQLKKQYLKKVQDVWRKVSVDFREGEVPSQEKARKVMEEASRGAKARAKTIVETETTNYYNKVRREYYDQSDAVTHYLFLAIRDQATTKWCSDKVSQGKRGRHGLVYEKGDPLTDRETPAIHWNCRSEMVPLSPFNPRHKELIENKRMYRANHSCHPLPKGWE